MPRLRRISGQEAIKALERLGFTQVRQKGSHVILKKRTPQGEIGCVVPLHPKAGQDYRTAIHGEYLGGM